MTDSKHVPSVIVRNRDRSAVITRSFTVEGADSMPAQYSGKPFQPDVIIVKLQDGAVTQVSVSGPRGLTSAQQMRTRARKSWYTSMDIDRDAPEWVKDTVATVLRMEQAGRGGR